MSMQKKTSAPMARSAVFSYVGLVLDVVPLHAVHLEQVVEVVHIALVLGVVGIPNLGKERIGLCNVVVIHFFWG